MAHVSTCSISLHGHRVSYRCGGDGPLLVLIHGITSSSASWEPVLPELAEHFTILAPDLHAFFAGDTGYSKDFADIRAHLAERQSEQAGGGFDIALLPIGGYEPRWFMAQQHVDPAEAVRIHLELGAKRSIGMHWGTFQLTDEALDQPPLELAAARTARGLPEDAFSTMAVGQTLRLARRDTR